MKTTMADSTHGEALKRSIMTFPLGDPQRPLAFARRLVRESGWTVLHTLRVIEEYRRFLVVAALGGHPVSPSADVDEAWHTHILFTRNYWEQFCESVLGRPLHHDPDTGQASTAGTLDDWYARTLESYEAIFHEAPPADLWPTHRLGAAAVESKSTGDGAETQAGIGKASLLAAMLGVTAVAAGCGVSVNAATIAPSMVAVLAVVGVVLLVILVLLVRAMMGSGTSTNRRHADGGAGGAGGGCGAYYGMTPTLGGTSDTGSHKHPHAVDHNTHGHGHDNAGESGDAGSGDSGSGSGDGGGGGGGDGGGGGGGCGGGCGGGD